jgi:hypothetical protein
LVSHNDGGDFGAGASGILITTDSATTPSDFRPAGLAAIVSIAGQNDGERID